MVGLINHQKAEPITDSFHRPKGKMKPADSDRPVFGPTRLLDIELETAFVIGKSTKLGESISTARADDYIFGMLLFNDWSARVEVAKESGWPGDILSLAEEAPTRFIHRKLLWQAAAALCSMRCRIHL